MKTKDPLALTRLFCNYRPFVAAVGAGLTAKEVGNTCLFYFAPSRKVLRELIEELVPKTILTALDRAFDGGRAKYGVLGVGFHAPDLSALMVENGLPAFTAPAWLNVGEVKDFLSERHGWLEFLRGQGRGMKIDE